MKPASNPAPRSSASLPALLQAARRAVTLACGVTRAVQADIARAGSVTKDDRSPVTVADFAAQAVVAHSLALSLGANSDVLRIVGEESAGLLRQPDHASVRSMVVDAVRTAWPQATEHDVLDAIDACNHDATASSYWTLDPVDGTKGFLRGGQYALALAFIDQGQVMLGAMGCPNLSADLLRDFNDLDPTGLVFIASRGGGTFAAPANDPHAAPSRIHVSDVSPADPRLRVCESVESSHTKHDDTARIVERLGGAGASARLDSQAKYAVVARGQADAYLRLPTKPGYVEKIWDHAAGMIVAAEAGAIVTDIDGKPLDFSLGAGLAGNRGVVCANPRFHANIIHAIRVLGVGTPKM